MHTYIQAYTHTHAYIHTGINTHTHAYMHTGMEQMLLSPLQVS
jgi:hypothetical protein